MGAKSFKTGKEFQEYEVFCEKQNNNEKEYARQHKSEKRHIIFHGGCIGCVTPLHYGLGNCLGCLYFNGVISKFPDLKIEKFLDEDDQFSLQVSVTKKVKT